MRMFALALLIGCGNPGLGTSEGLVTYLDPDNGDPIEVTFEGGAVVWERAGSRWMAVTDWGKNFDCEYAQVHLVGLPGREIDRGRSHHELLWNELFPYTATMLYTKERQGAVTTLGAPELEAEMTFDDEARTMGTLVTEGGTVTFAAYDCGAL